jgi:uncharacterized membrane protein required for colicin V production
MVFIVGMTIWILALLLLASGVLMGLKQGAIRAAFSFVGIVFAGLLAVPLGKLFKPLLPHVGIHNETLIWLIAPIEGFVVVLILFKMAGFFVHRKVDVHYKYHAGDLRLALWQRMNSRLGACVGTLNGAAYLVLVCFVIYNLSYWTVQIASDDNESRTAKFVNNLGRDLQNTGMTKAARSVAALPEDYYKMADLAGLICQNPQLSDRLGRYPAFISLFEGDDFQQLAQDADFTNAWQSHAPVGEIMNQPAVKNLLQNTNLVNTVWTTIETNLDDLTNYLQTGTSPKYDSEKIVGFWDFNASVTLAMLRETEPNIPSSEMRSVRALWTQAYAQTIFIAGTDGQAFLKNLPNFKSKPPSPETWTGSWTADDTNYDLILTSNGENKSMTAKISNDRLTLSDDKTTLIFDREE